MDGSARSQLSSDVSILHIKGGLLHREGGVRAAGPPFAERISGHIGEAACGPQPEAFGLGEMGTGCLWESFFCFGICRRRGYHWECWLPITHVRFRTQSQKLKGGKSK